MKSAFSAMAIALAAASLAVGQMGAEPDIKIPLGVYWPGEMIPGVAGQNEQAQWEYIGKCLDDMKAHNVNAVWLTHKGVGYTAKLARLAADRGIGVVASCAELALEAEQHRNVNYVASVSKGIAEKWGDAPAPLAFGLGDEPRTHYMKEIGYLERVFRQYAPEGSATTSVVMPGDLRAAFVSVDFSVYCVDVYPFFSAGNPNGPGTHASSTAYYKGACQSAAMWANQKQVDCWVMGQFYQEPWGPMEVDENGDIFHLPGGGPHWRLPTIAETRWQTWAGLACGAKGVFYFLYCWPTASNPGAKPLGDQFGFKVNERTPSGGPRALVYRDGRATPQYDALGETFAKVNKIADILSDLTPVETTEIGLAAGWPDAGDLATPMAAPDGRLFVCIVNGNMTQRREIKVALQPGIARAVDLITGKPHKLTTTGALKEIAVPLEAGDGTLIELERMGFGRLGPQLAAVEKRPAAPTAAPVTPAAQVGSYSEDFSDDKYLKDAMEARNVKRYGTVLSASSGGAGAANAYVVYDLEKLLKPQPLGRKRHLIYEGACNGPDHQRGVHWWQSDDGKNWQVLSVNEFGKKIELTKRFLKVGMMWIQAESHHYGYLDGFTVVQ